MDAHDNEAFAILHRYYDREHDKIRGGVENIAYDVANALRAAFAAGREAMRSECAGAMDELCAKYLGNAAACVNKSDTRTALDMADAFDRASIAIRALPGKEA